MLLLLLSLQHLSCPLLLWQRRLLVQQQPQPPLSLLLVWLLHRTAAAASRCGLPPAAPNTSTAPAWIFPQT
jgi:hypothetical protein